MHFAVFDTAEQQKFAVRRIDAAVPVRARKSKTRADAAFFLLRGVDCDRRAVGKQKVNGQKQALCLVSNGYHPDEIARMCGIRSKSVSARIGRARKVAKQVLVSIG